jgi:phosphodiesterase/alkaline phosphatase D-like protein
MFCCEPFRRTPELTICYADHEVADNTYRDGSSELNNTEDSFIRDGGVAVDQRKMNAVRAYFEWSE